MSIVIGENVDRDGDESVEIVDRDRTPKIVEKLQSLMAEELTDKEKQTFVSLLIEGTILKHHKQDLCVYSLIKRERQNQR